MCIRSARTSRPPLLARDKLPDRGFAFTVALPVSHCPLRSAFCSLFCSTILFATEHWLGYLVGSITFVNAAFNGYVICVHPAFRTGELSAHGDPFGGYTGGEQEMLAYLKSNPELAKKAGAAAVKVAQNNPDLAMQVAAGAHGGSGANPWGGGK